MPKFAANLSMMFNEVPFPQRFAAAAAAGFKGVEFLFPYDFPAADVAAKLKDNKLAMVLHNLPAGNWAGGERGIACHPDRVGSHILQRPSARQRLNEVPHALPMHVRRS